MKLKKLIESVFEENEINEEEFLSDVANYNQFGKSIYRNDSIYDVAKKLSEIARQANIHTVRETEDSFDKITVSRNMKELKSYSDQFHKVAKEAHGLQQRMESLYEDMGRVLNRYYEINEAHVYGHDDEDSELEEGGPGSGRPTKKGSKRDIEKRMDKAVSDANAKLDAAEKAMKKKNEGKLNEKFDLKKLEDAIKMFQQKIKKQGRVTNARDEQHLKQLIKVYKDMGGRKIKEGKLSEAISFDVKKMTALVKKDKFLKYVAKKDFKGRINPRALEQMYFMYVKGDRGYEKLYKKIK